MPLIPLQLTLEEYRQISMSLQEIELEGNTNMPFCFEQAKENISPTDTLPSSFLRNFTNKVSKAQKKIEDIIKKHEEKDRAEKLQEQKYMMPLLKDNIKFLSGNPYEILYGNILHLYLQISEINSPTLKEKESQEQKPQNDTNIVAQVLQELTPLVCDYFIVKQYKKKTQKKYVLQSESVKSISSEEESNKEVKNPKRRSLKNQRKRMSCFNEQQNIKLLRSIQDQFKDKSIDQFIEQYIEEQEKEMIDELEVCRICERQIKLKDIVKHIKYCSQKAKVKTEMSELKVEWRQIMQKIREQENILCNIPLYRRSQQENAFMKFLKKAKENQDSNKLIKSIRRNSQFSKASSHKIALEVLIEQSQIYEIYYGRNELMENIIENKKKEELLQKKLNTLQVNQILLQNGSQQTSFGIFVESVQNVIQSQIKTKKSLFAQSIKKISEFSASSSSSLSSHRTISSQMQQLNISQKDEQEDLQKLDKIMKPSSRKTNLLNSEEFEETDKRLMKQRPWKTQKILFKNDIFTEDNLSLKDFQILKFLGKGAYGNVYLVRRIKTKGLYALKHIKYDEYTPTAQIQLIKKEHEIFRKIAGDHLVKAPYAFSESFGHFFVLQFMPGGDLSRLLAEQVYLEQNQAKFYLAETVLALEYLHSCDIIHRDLKPQNLVLDKDGHLKLTDFGLSQIKMRNKISKALENNAKSTISKPKKTNRRAALVTKTEANKIIGTPDYIAPEIINRTSINNKSIDWWSLGVLTYQVLIGCRPFSAETIEQVLDNIIEGNIIWPQIGQEEGMISSEAFDLIQKLLDKNFQNRLGSLGASQIKSHPFFKGINWENIKLQRPPFLQSLGSGIYETLQQDKKLREEIEKNKQHQDQNGAISIARSKSLKIQSFVRYDLLIEETYESMQKKINEKSGKLKKLQSLLGDTRGPRKEKNKNKRIRFTISTEPGQK